MYLFVLCTLLTGTHVHDWPSVAEWSLLFVNMDNMCMERFGNLRLSHWHVGFSDVVGRAWISTSEKCLLAWVLIHSNEFMTRSHVWYTPRILRANGCTRSWRQYPHISSHSPWGRAFWLGSEDSMSKQGKVLASHAVTVWHNKGLITLLRRLLILNNVLHLRVSPLL